MIERNLFMKYQKNIHNCFLNNNLEELVIILQIL